MTFFNIFTVQKLKPYIQTNRKKNLTYTVRYSSVFKSELFACVWILSPLLRGREYKLHFNLTSFSSFKFSCTMKVMLFTVPICLKACLYLVCACVCKSVEKSPIYFTLQSSQVFQTNWLFILCQVSSLSSWNLHLWKKAVYTSNSPCICLYNSLSLATRMCVSMSHISPLCVHINMHTMYMYAHVLCVLH